MDKGNVMVWPVGDDFEVLLNRAVKERGEAASRMRDALAGPDIVGRTVQVLGQIVDRIDEHLTVPDEDERRQASRELARDRMYEHLVWFETMQRLVCHE